MAALNLARYGAPTDSQLKFGVERIRQQGIASTSGIQKPLIFLDSRSRYPGHGSGVARNDVWIIQRISDTPH